jgi:hypothetical protein
VRLNELVAKYQATLISTLGKIGRGELPGVGGQTLWESGVFKLFVGAKHPLNGYNNR